MKNVAIKFCAVQEARRRAKKYGLEEHMSNDTIFGLDVKLYKSFNNIPYTITDVGTVVALSCDDGYTWYLPKIFLDIREI